MEQIRDSKMGDIEDSNQDRSCDEIQSNTVTNTKLTVLLLTVT
jgi:hypothetical protein